MRAGEAKAGEAKRTTTEVAFTPAVKAEQERRGSRAGYARLEEKGPERAIVLTVDAWDVNCPQHIVRRFTAEQISAAIEPLQRRIAELERRSLHCAGAE